MRIFLTIFAQHVKEFWNYETPLSFMVLKQMLMSQVLDLDSKIQEISKEVFEKKSLLVLGRGYNYATCLEGALVSSPLCFMTWVWG